MQKYSNEQYNDVFEKLPAPLKDMVASTATSEKIFAIAQRHKMQIDQAGILNDLTLDVLMGIIASKDLRREVVKETGVSEMDASLILRDIDEEILKPVKALMFTIYADGAPFKPTGMKTLNETEEDHQALKKEDILKEIESPTPSEIKKIISNFPAPEIKKESLGKLSVSKEVEEYKDELVAGKSLKLEAKSLETKEELAPRSLEPEKSSSVIEESKKRILDNIGAIKLAGVVTMPKMNQEIKETLPETPKINSIPETAPAQPKKIIDIKQPLSEKISYPTQKPNLAENIPPQKTPPTISKPAPAKPYSGDPYREPIE